VRERVGRSKVSQMGHGSLSASGGLGSGGQHHSMFDWDVYDHDPHEAQDL
jgi:hypothetical protein